MGYTTTMTWRKRITATLLLTGAFFAGSMAGPADASAVTYSYCYSSLRGGGSLAPDQDILRYAENHNVQTIYSEGMSGGSGSYTVYETVRMYRGGDVWRVKFYCSGSGSTYSDGRTY